MYVIVDDEGPSMWRLGKTSYGISRPERRTATLHRADTDLIVINSAGPSVSKAMVAGVSQYRGANSR